MKKEFKRLNYANMEKYYRTHKLTKGALVRYRFNHNTILSYSLAEEESWRIGIISDVNWYIFKSPASLYVTKSENEQICYDLTVYPNGETGIEMINLESNEDTQ